MKTLRIGAGLAALLAVSGSAMAVTVTPSMLNGWQQVNSGTSTGQFENGPATPPLGSGSYELNVGSDGNGAAQLRGTNQHLLSLSDINSLSYSTYVDQDGSGGQAPYILLNLDTNNDASTVEDLMFFEPVYQSATFFPSNPQSGLLLDTWQTWDARNGGWYTLNGAGGSGPGTNVKDWATILAAIPSARIVNSISGLGGFRLVAGFGAGAWDNFIGNVDNLAIGTTSGSVTYDFEMDAAAVPLPLAAVGGVALMGAVGAGRRRRASASHA